VEGSFGQVARRDEARLEERGDLKPWYYIALWCKCMITSPDETNRHGEVNWREDEMVFLTDDQALALMESHTCRKIGEEVFVMNRKYQELIQRVADLHETWFLQAAAPPGAGARYRLLEKEGGKPLFQDFRTADQVSSFLDGYVLGQEKK